MKEVNLQSRVNAFILGALGATFVMTAFMLVVLLALRDQKPDAHTQDQVFDLCPKSAAELAIITGTEERYWTKMPDAFSNVPAWRFSTKDADTLPEVKMKNPFGGFEGPYGSGGVIGQPDHIFLASQGMWYCFDTIHAGLRP